MVRGEMAGGEMVGANREQARQRAIEEGARALGVQVSQDAPAEGSGLALLRALTAEQEAGRLDQAEVGGAMRRFWEREDLA